MEKSKLGFNSLLYLAEKYKKLLKLEYLLFVSNMRLFSKPHKCTPNNYPYEMF